MLFAERSNCVCTNILITHFIKIVLVQMQKPFASPPVAMQKGDKWIHEKHKLDT